MAITSTLPSADALAAVADRDGLVNFEVVSANVARQFGGRLVDGRIVNATSDPARGETAAALINHADLLIPAMGSATTPSAAATTGGGDCYVTLVQDYGTKDGIVGQTNSKTTGISHDFTYTAGASSSLGIGYSANGSYGSFSQSGTMAKSSTSTWGYPVQGDNIARRYHTYWRYGKYELSCGWYTDPWYEARTSSFAGGTALSSVGFPGYKYCVNFVGGSDFTKDTNSAYNFTTGISIASSIGIDLSTQTGYTTNAKIHYHNKITSLRHLCGYGDYPAGKTSFVVAIT